MLIILHRSLDERPGDYGFPQYDARVIKLILFIEKPILFVLDLKQTGTVKYILIIS